MIFFLIKQHFLFFINRAFDQMFFIKQRFSVFRQTFVCIKWLFDQKAFFLLNVFLDQIVFLIIFFINKPFFWFVDQMLFDQQAFFCMFDWMFCLSNVFCWSNVCLIKKILNGFCDQFFWSRYVLRFFLLFVFWSNVFF